ncbi:unnamed protein product [Ilex paraguariensis]|uniref:Uncharacterized protein n=1 Tax=Ilex paraguariensis TaxID=185542 RepID=A0ABC8U269_9AQUA
MAPPTPTLRVFCKRGNEGGTEFIALQFLLGESTSSLRRYWSVEMHGKYMIGSLVYLSECSKDIFQFVVENVFAFNGSFWIRLVARTDTCKSEEILYFGSNLFISLSSALDEEEDISWPPRVFEALFFMEKVINDLLDPSAQNLRVREDAQINRRTLICAVNPDAEKSFKKTVEVDRLIDMLRGANDKEGKINSATDVLKEALKPLVDEEEEISWPLRDLEGNQTKGARRATGCVVSFKS